MFEYERSSLMRTPGSGFLGRVFLWMLAPLIAGCIGYFMRAR